MVERHGWVFGEKGHKAQEQGGKRLKNEAEQTGGGRGLWFGFKK